MADKSVKPTATTSGLSAITASFKPKTRLIFVHGDKGGTGKSMVSRYMTDFLKIIGDRVALVEADTSNPDVLRMFTGGIPSQAIDLREEEGWMDMIDFCQKHLGYSIVVNLPGGIGNYLNKHLKLLEIFTGEQENIETELWWVMNINHDAVNLLDVALNSYGAFFNKVRVACNMFFTLNQEKEFDIWNESPLKTKIENQNGMTLHFYGLHKRVSPKLFAPENIMPFSEAMDVVLGERVGLSTSELIQLKKFWDYNERGFSRAFGVANPNRNQKTSAMSTA